MGSAIWTDEQLRQIARVAVSNVASSIELADHPRGIRVTHYYTLRTWFRSTDYKSWTNLKQLAVLPLQ